jgi:hypothetical protein
MIERIEPVVPLSARTVSMWTWLGRTQYFWPAVLITAVGIGLLLFEFPTISRELSFGLSGDWADARIVAMRRDGNRHLITIEFVATNRARYRVEHQVTRERYDQLLSRAAVKVQYLRANPNMHRLEGEVDNPMWPAIVGVGLVVLVPSAATAIGMWLRASSWQRLATTGKPTLAIVEHFEAQPVKRGQRPKYRVRYSYLDSEGERRQGLSPFLAELEIAELEPGDLGVAVVDPDNPRHSLWVGPRAEPIDAPAKETAPEVEAVAAPEPDPAPLATAPARPETVTGPALVGMSNGVDAWVHALDKRRITVGRSLISDIRVDDDSLALQHAELVERAGQWTIEPMIGAGDLTVNGEAIEATRPLEGGEIIGVGDVRLRFVAPPGVPLDATAAPNESPR